jgi:tetratricopeptide (TPR) repeat protein
MVEDVTVKEHIIMTSHDREIFDEFTNLMHQGRVAMQRNSTRESKDLYREAAQYARRHGREIEAQIAAAAIHQLNGQLPEATEILEHVLRLEGLKLRGLAFFYLGSVRRRRGLWDAAIEAYEEVLADGRLEWRSFAINNLGDLYELRATTQEDEAERVADEERALEKYREALRIDCDTPTRYIEKYNLGRLSLKLDHEAEAISTLQEALEDARSLDKPDLRICGWIGRELGTAYFRSATRGDTRIDASSELRDKRSRTPSHILVREPQGSLHVERVQEAIELWRQAADDLYPEELSRHRHRDRQDRDQAAVIRAKIRYAETLLAEQDRTESTRLVALGTNEYRLLRWLPDSEVQIENGYSSPEERIFTKIISAEQDAYQRYAAESGHLAPDAYQEHRRHESKESPYESVLAILRGWGSAIPLIEEEGNNCRGGGYFLKWRGKGLAIDPGLDFLRNFRECGFHLREINAVITSHDHPDHNFDLNPFDDLRYEIYRRAGDDREDWRYSIILDKDTFRKFEDAHKSSWPLHIGPAIESFELHRYQEYVLKPREDGDNPKLDKVTIDLQKEAGLPFRIRYFQARHSADQAVGFCIECLEDNEVNGSAAAVTIGFTGDTGFFEELCDSAHLGGCDILIPHISQPDLWELVSHSERKNDMHLGYRGVEKLIKGIDPKPQVTLIGEFWAGLADLRVDIVQGLRQVQRRGETVPSNAVLPTSVGLFVDPKTCDIQCSKCGDWTSYERITVAAPVSFGSPAQKFGPLSYLCPLCSIVSKEVTGRAK